MNFLLGQQQVQMNRRNHVQKLASQQDSQIPIECQWGHILLMKKKWHHNFQKLVVGQSVEEIQDEFMVHSEQENDMT